MKISIGIDISPSLANSLTAVLRRGFIIGVRFQGVNGELLLYTHYKEILLPSRRDQNDIETRPVGLVSHKR